MRRIFAAAAIALGFAAVGLVAASSATANADTGINYTVGPVSYSCSPCTSTTADTTTTITLGGTTDTFSTKVPNTKETYLNNTVTTSSGSTSTNFYVGDLGVWGGSSASTPQGGTTGSEAGYYTKTGTVSVTPIKK